MPGHRHHPEIAQGLARAAGRAVNLVFVPHLVPMIRGIHATLYARLTGKADLQALYEKRYAGEAFVDVHARRQPSRHALGAGRELSAASPCTSRRAATSWSCCR